MCFAKFRMQSSAFCDRRSGLLSPSEQFSNEEVNIIMQEVYDACCMLARVDMVCSAPRRRVCQVTASAHIWQIYSMRSQLGGGGWVELAGEKEGGN